MKINNKTQTSLFTNIPRYHIPFWHQKLCQFAFVSHTHTYTQLQNDQTLLTLFTKFSHSKNTENSKSLIPYSHSHTHILILSLPKAEVNRNSLYMPPQCVLIFFSRNQIKNSKQTAAATALTMAA